MNCAKCKYVNHGKGAAAVILCDRHALAEKLAAALNDCAKRLRVCAILNGMTEEWADIGVSDFTKLLKEWDSTS